MAKIVVLGSAGAVNDARHDYTHMLLLGERDKPLLIDVGSNPLGKIQKLGISDNELRDIVLTHFHSDHVGGVPNMLQHMWLLGRRSPLNFYGLHHCINRMKDVMENFGWRDWEGLFPVNFHPILERDDAFVLETEDFVVHSYPVKHYIPTIGLRVENKVNGKVLGYTCDTQTVDCPNVLRIAQSVDVLIHEAAGPPPGHSTARQAGETATQAGAQELYLIHYLVWNTNPDVLVPQAQETFSGAVALAVDGMVIDF